MVPSSAWFPTGWAERVEWFNTFSTAFAALGAGLGFTPAEVTAVANDNVLMQFMGNNIPAAENYAEAVRSFRRVVTEGTVDGTTPDWPAAPLVIPGTLVPQGIFERLDNLVKRIRLAPGYTDEEGDQLGIVPKKASNIAPADAQPTLTATVEPGNVVLVKFKKGQFTGVFLQTMVDKTTWTDQGRYTRSPIEIVIPQNQDELPRLVAIRARYLVGDNAVGNWSPIITVQTTP